MLSLLSALHIDDIKRLCSEHFLDIVHGDDRECRDLVVRYISGEGKFGYAHFGSYFFMDDCMYLLRNMHDPDDDSNPDIFEDFFGNYFEDKDLAWNDCRRVIFAGVRTVNKDVNGEWIYTGDIVEDVKDDLNWGGVAAAPGEYPSKEGPQYAIMADNCCCLLRDTKGVRRLGTIFYQLEKDAIEVEIERECILLHCQGSLPKEEVLQMAVYTPSFQQEFWKYRGMKILGVEYSWRN